MTHKLSSLVMIAFMLSCGPSDVWWYGDVDMGDEYFYMVDPAFNSIQTISTDDSGRSNGYVIQNIELIGYNNDFIMAANKDSLTLKYWIIDKKRASKLFRWAMKNGKVNEEVIGPLDSVYFTNFAATHKITILSKTYYRKKLNYE